MSQKWEGDMNIDVIGNSAYFNEKFIVSLEISMMKMFWMFWRIPIFLRKCKHLLKLLLKSDIYSLTNCLTREKFFRHKNDDSPIYDVFNRVTSLKK